MNTIMKIYKMIKKHTRIEAFYIFVTIDVISLLIIKINMNFIKCLN